MKNVIYNNLFLLSKVKKYSPLYILYIIISAIVQASASVLSVLGIKYIIETLEKGNIKSTFIAIIVYCLLTMVIQGYFKWTFYYFPLLSEKVSRGMTIEKMSASQKLDFQCFDIPEFHDAYTRALSSGEQQVNMLMGTLIALLSNIASIIALVTIISTYSVLLLVIVVAKTVISYLVIENQNKLDYSYNHDNVTFIRRQDYFKGLCFSKETQMEDRVFGVLDYVKNEYCKNFSLLFDFKRKYLKKRLFFDYFEVVLSVVLKILSLFILAFEVLNGGMHISDFVATLNGMESISGQLLSLVINFPKLSLISRYTNDYRKIVEYKPDIEKRRILEKTGKFPEGYKIEFKDVSFKYPGSENNALNHVSFTLKSGERLAIVGENGAGKSTIVKLLLRLYDPTDGIITFNNLDIRKLDVNSWREHITAIFQDYVVYSFSLEDNIWFLRKGDSIKQLDKVGLEKYVKYNLSNKMLTRRFDPEGIILSGGEEQRLCIARAFGKESEMIIMDEPTSSLDPIIEDNIIKKVIDYSEHNSMLIITHKLSMCKYADNIIYLENGNLKESGCHSELLSLHGSYYNMYRIQANQYDIDCD